ncbi:MAG: preprotein translocase subunit Sec61beta [Candidatus Nanoarchaeia archaeon]
MPSSTAGLTRFYDESRSKIQFNPNHLVVMIIVVIVFHLMLHALG